MGYFKNIQIEQESSSCRGYSLPIKGQRFVCSDHYSDKFLKRYIENSGCDGICSYCGKKNTVIDLYDFIEYIGKKLSSVLENIDDACLFLESSFYDDDEDEIIGYKRFCGYVTPDIPECYNSTEEIIEHFELKSNNDNLNNDILSYLHMDNWIRKNPTNMTLNEELSFMWNEFSRLVKNERRYTFFKSPMFENIDLNKSDNSLFDILSELGGILSETETILPIETTLFRCRSGNENDKINSFEDITAPPPKLAKSNRFSPMGISMFYGSYDIDTSHQEVLNYSDKTTSYLAEFQTTQELILIDLTSVKSSFWKDDFYQERLFLKKFHSEISKPIKSDESELEYIPSQIFTEYVRYICKNKDGKRYDGIIYNSSLTKKKNVVLFYDDKTTHNILSLNSIKFRD